VGFLKDFGVGQGEVRWGERFDKVAGKEVDFFLGRLVYPLQTADCFVDAPGCDQVGLFDEVKEKVFFRSVRLTRSCSHRNEADFLLH
jgi:hypothetical protein